MLTGITVCILVLTAVPYSAVRVVAALPDLGSIAAAIGGNNVEVSAIAKANANPHSVEVLPSYMAKVSRAAVYLKSGLGLDQWSDAVVDGSRNNKLLVVDCSEGVTVLDKPVKVDASMGDVHPFGNPHYWLDPRNGIIIARNIAAGLITADPSHRAEYEAALATFENELNGYYEQWRGKLAGLAGHSIISYHSSWAYFADAFGLTIEGHIEPFPGIPPTGSHLAALVGLIKNRHIILILQEPYFSDDATRFLNRQTGIPVVKTAPSCADVKADSYRTHFGALVSELLNATGGK